MFGHLIVAIGALLTAAPLYGQNAIPAWRETGWCNYRYPLDKPVPVRLSLPDWACELSYNKGLQRTYTPDTKRNPFFLSGDFDGDGQTDVAIWITNNRNRKRGVLILTHGKEPFIAGAGANRERGDDYFGLDAWSLLLKGEVLESVWENRKIVLSGDAIILEKSESAAFVIYWDGKQFAFYQVSD